MEPLSYTPDMTLALILLAAGVAVFVAAFVVVCLAIVAGKGPQSIYGLAVIPLLLIGFVALPMGLDALMPGPKSPQVNAGYEAMAERASDVYGIDLSVEQVEALDAFDTKNLDPTSVAREFGTVLVRTGDELQRVTLAWDGDRLILLGADATELARR